MTASAIFPRFLFPPVPSPALPLKTGTLRLRLNRKEDIFHAEELSSIGVLPVYEQLIGIPKIGFGHGNFYRSGVRFEALRIDIEKKDTVVEGFFEDSSAGTFPYEINIYLTYEIEE